MFPTELDSVSGGRWWLAEGGLIIVIKCVVRSHAQSQEVHRAGVVQRSAREIFTQLDNGAKVQGFFCVE